MDPGFQRFCAAFGERVRALRRARGMTQEDMMDRGFVLRHYQRIEAGRSVTLQTVWKLARAFGVSPRLVLPPTPPAAKGRRGRPRR
jgi:transcriptional regulator with XRE-family HTH domain